jgi:hypothetical protein
MRMTRRNAAKSRMVFKVLVLGHDSGRRNGFLSLAAGECVSSQLHSSIGVSLGVAQAVLSDGSNVALQLWSLPEEHRYESLVRSFVRGHRVAVVILEAGDEETINELTRALPSDWANSAVIVRLDSGEDIQRTRSILKQAAGTELSELRCRSVNEIVQAIAQSVVERSAPCFPLLVTLPEDACPTYEPEPRGREETCNSPEEIHEIQDIVAGLGLRVEDEECFINLEEGEARVSLRTGQIVFRPTVCSVCRMDCKRVVSICIVSQDAGWSSEGISKHALLTAAKIVALAQRELPQHVEMQLVRASVCSLFSPEEGTPDEVLEGFIASAPPCRNKQSLLEIADRRVREGRLPENIYSMLKKRLDRLSSVPVE